MSELIVHQGYVPPAIEARVTDPEPPGYHSAARDYFILDLMEKAAAAGGFHLTPHTALTYSAIWAAVRFISQTLAGVDWPVYDVTPQGKRRRPIEDNIAWTLGMQANPEMSAFDWRQAMLKDALLVGNGYSEIEFSNSGVPLWLWRVDPSRVSLERDEDTGALYYWITGPRGGEGRALDPSQVYHLKGLGPDGLVGWSVIGLARRSIELGIRTEQYGATFFGRGPMPGGVLGVPGAMKKADRDEMRESFQRTYGGSANAGRVVVLSGGATFTPLALPNEDAQFLESRTFQIEEIARWFGVPPHKLADLVHATFSNIEHQSIEVVQDTFRPWARRLETEADIKLFGRTTRGRRFTRLDLGPLLRGDSKTHTENIARRVTAGLETINEGRDELDLNPLDGGDTPLIQGAMTPLDDILNPPEPPPAVVPMPPPDTGEGDGEDMPEEVAAVFRALLGNVYAAMLRVEEDKARRAGNKGHTRQWAAYLADSGPRVAALRPTVEAFLLATRRRGDAGALAACLEQAHTAASRAQAAAGKPVNGRAESQAREHLGILWRAVHAATK